MSQAIYALSDPVDRDFVDGFVRSTSPESQSDDVVHLLVDESLKVPATVWKETLRGLIDADLPVALDRVSAPTLLISGDQDTIVGSDQEILHRRTAASARRPCPTALQPQARPALATDRETVLS